MEQLGWSNGDPAVATSVDWTKKAWHRSICRDLLDTARDQCGCLRHFKHSFCSKVNVRQSLCEREMHAYQYTSGPHSTPMGVWRMTRTAAKHRNTPTDQHSAHGYMPSMSDSHRAILVQVTWEGTKPRDGGLDNEVMPPSLGFPRCPKRPPRVGCAI